MEWSVVYESAIRPDGSLLFPERLTKDFLDSARRTMGSYLYANQYLNQVIPEDEKRFKPQWLRYYAHLPELRHTFAFVDPAIGQKDHHDYTGITVVHVDADANWYVQLAARYRLTPTEIVAKLFELQSQFGCMAIGIEVVAYQEALLYILDEEMKRRQMIIPVKGIPRTKVSKETRILGLVPRFEWGKCFVSQGMIDFEDEYNTFPRGSHDDILDALASIEDVVVYPERRKEELKQPNSPHDPNYERWYIHQLAKRANSGGHTDE